jgi:hypothetical protein
LTRVLPAKISFAKSDQEKEAVFSFLGILPNTDNLPFAVQLASLNPQHPMLKLIVSREINRSEMYFPSNGDSDTYKESPEDSLRRINVKRETLGYQEKLNNFASKTGAELFIVIDNNNYGYDDLIDLTGQYGFEWEIGGKERKGVILLINNKTRKIFYSFDDGQILSCISARISQFSMLVKQSLHFPVVGL